MKNAEQPINPIVEDNNYNGNIVREARYLGLTKREYFAGLAMQAMISAITQFRTEVGMDGIIVNRPKDIAEISVVYADALLEQLEK